MERANALSVETHVLGEGLGNGELQCASGDEVPYGPCILVDVATGESEAVGGLTLNVLSGSGGGYEDIDGALTTRNRRMERDPSSRICLRFPSTALSWDQHQLGCERRHVR